MGRGASECPGSRTGVVERWLFHFSGTMEEPSPRLGSKLSEGTSGTAKWHKGIKTTGRKLRLGGSKGFARDSSEWKWKP